MYRSVTMTVSSHKVKDVGPGLVSNIKQVFESFSDEQRHSLSFPLQQRVSSYSSSHSNPVDVLSG